MTSKKIKDVKVVHTPKPIKMAEAPEQVPDEDLIQVGQAFPERVDNPETGKAGHHCVDLQGRYDPTWKSVFIHKGSQGADSQVFGGEDNDRWLVRTGLWVDVPPIVVQILEDTVIERVMQEEKSNPDLSVLGMETVISTEPRFQYSVRDSA